MKISNRIIILITLIFSASYILGLDYYDRKETEIRKRFEQVKRPEFICRQINFQLSGIKSGEKLNEQELTKRQIECVKALAHLDTCSKLCTQEHENNAQSEYIKDPNGFGVRIFGTNQNTVYEVVIKVQERESCYRIKMQGSDNIEAMDNLRNRAVSLFERWGINPQENLSFIGEAEGKFSTIQRKEYVADLFNTLKADYRGYYQDDFGKDTEAYYGYSKEIKEYIIGSGGKKNNVQIGFSYNEQDDYTQIIAAFPFYNEPF